MATFGAPSSVVTATPNFTSFEALKFLVSTSGTPVNLSSLTIPDGAKIALRAKETNGGKKIFVANSSANTAISTSRIVLSKGEAITMQLQNLNAIWIDASGNNADIEVLVEQ